MPDFSRSNVTARIKPDGSGFTVVAGTSTPLNSDIVDIAGYEGVRFIMGFGAIVSGAVTSVKVQQGAISSLSDAADLASSSVTIADTDDNKVCIIDVYRPNKRYLRLVTARATQNATLDFLAIEKYGPRKAPVTQDTTLVAAGIKILISPAEGTA